jgi:hypothetical protein
MDKNKYNFPNINVYLNDQEIKEIEGLNAKANAARFSKQMRDDPDNVTVRDFFSIWANKNLAIFIDLVAFFSKLEKYSIYFEDVDNTKQWYSGIQKMLVDFIMIFIRDTRAIYIGITLVILSFLLYMIDVSG